MRVSIPALCLPLMLIGGIAGAAISDEAKKCDMAKCRQLLKTAKEHAQATKSAINNAKAECEKAAPSEDKTVLKGAVTKANLSLS